MLCLTTHSSAFGTRVQESFRTELLSSACRRGVPPRVSVIEVLTASSSTSPDSCRLCRRAKRFELPFGFGRQDKVALRQTLNLVRPDLDHALPPGQIQIRIKALCLRDSPQPYSQMPSPVESSATGSCFNNSCEDPSTEAHWLHHYISGPPASSESPLNCSRCRVHLLRRTGWSTGLISGWTTCSLSGRRRTGGGRR